MISPISFGLLLTAVAALAQVGGLPPSFEVASVKTSAPIVSKEGKDRIGMTISGARVEINYATLAELVRIAYRVRLDQVTVPDRAASEHFDVAAKMADGASQDRMPERNSEIIACGFFAPDSLPPDTTRGTRQRIAEVLENRPPPQDWS